MIRSCPDVYHQSDLAPLDVRLELPGQRAGLLPAPLVHEVLGVPQVAALPGIRRSRIQAREPGSSFSLWRAAKKRWRRRRSRVSNSSSGRRPSARSRALAKLSSASSIASSRPPSLASPIRSRRARRSGSSNGSMRQPRSAAGTEGASGREAGEFTRRDRREGLAEQSLELDEPRATEAAVLPALPCEAPVEANPRLAEEQPIRGEVQEEQSVPAGQDVAAKLRVHGLGLEVDRVGPARELEASPRSADARWRAACASLPREPAAGAGWRVVRARSG